MKNSTETKKYSTDLGLGFVNKKELSPLIVKNKIKEKYFKNSNDSPSTKTGDIDMSNLSFLEISKKYGIKQGDLYKTYEILENMAIEIGVDLEYVDLSNFSEDEYYGNNTEEEKHAETARSDGKKLLLEQNLNLAEGIEGRMYDLMHVGFGHMVQWSGSSSDLILNAEQAWAIGYRNHDKSSQEVLELVKLYEFEGGILGIQKIKEAINQTNISNENGKKIIQFFTDFSVADREFIMSHYQGEHKALSSFWKVGTPTPNDFVYPQVDFKKRDFVELGVIRELKK